MAVKMLTTKKHSKMAKLIQKSKEPIEVIKADPKNMVDKPIGKTIESIKETNIVGIREQANMVAINEPKPIKERKVKVVKERKVKVVKERKVKDAVTKTQYNEAIRIIKLYYSQMALNEIKSYEELTNYKFDKSEKNQINLYKEISVRVANRLCVYFREKGVELDMHNFDVAYLKHINLSEINQMRNFGKGSLNLLTEYLDKLK